RPATRHMREKRRGRIIAFTSTAGLEGSPGQPNYSAAKEGIVGLTRSTALAMARYGVTVNCISPSAETRMTERLPDDRRAQAAAPAGCARNPLAAEEGVIEADLSGASAQGCRDSGRRHMAGLARSGRLRNPDGPDHRYRGSRSTGSRVQRVSVRRRAALG